MEKTMEQIFDFFNVNVSNIPVPSVCRYELNKCYCRDSIQAMRKIKSKSFDLVIADPPFAIDFDKLSQGSCYNRKGDNVLTGYVEVSVNSYYDFSLKWIRESKRIVKDDGIVIIVSGWSNQKDILNACSDIGLVLLNQIIWRHQFGPFTKRKMVSSHYNIFIFVKDRKNYTFNKVLWYPEDVMYSEQWEPEIMEINKEYWINKKKTPTKLPKELVEMLVVIFSNKGDLLCDPFSGAGTILKVSNYMGRFCLAFDVVKEYVDFSNERLDLEY